MDLSCEPNVYASCSTSEIRVRLVTSNMLKPSSNCLTDRSKAVLLLWILFLLFAFRVCLAVLSRIFQKVPNSCELTCTTAVYIQTPVDQQTSIPTDPNVEWILNLYRIQPLKIFSDTHYIMLWHVNCSFPIRRKK